MGRTKKAASVNAVSSGVSTDEGNDRAKAIVANAAALFESIAARPDARQAFTNLTHAAAQPASVERTARMYGVVKKMGLETDPLALMGIRGGVIRREETARRAEDSVAMLFAYDRQQLDKKHVHVTGVAITKRGTEGAPQVTHFNVPLEAGEKRSVTRSVAHFLASGLK